MSLMNVGLWLGMMTMLSGPATMAAPATGSAATMDQSQRAARLLWSISADAVHVRSIAARLDHLTESSNATWLDFDRQWNAIKPLQEDMQMKLWRLERMQASLSPEQHKQLDSSKMLIQEIRSRTHELRALLDTPGVQTTNAQFTLYARSLLHEASRLEHATSAG